MLIASTDDPIAHFLILCLRSRFDAGALNEAQDWMVCQDLNWKTIEHRAASELLIPILYSLLRKQSWPPSKVLTRWHRRYIRTGLDNMLLMAELAHIGRAFDQSGIPFIALKGAALLGSVYPNIALRRMTDADLLIHQGDMLRAIKIIQALGYAPRHQEEYPGIFLAYENEIALQRLEGMPPMIVELHWSLIDSPYYQERLPMAWFWETAIPAQVGELSTLMLRPEALLLHLIVHLVLHHQGQGLRWWHDVAEVISHFGPSMDWDLLLDRGRHFRLLLPLQQVLPIVVEYWRVSVPPTILDALARLEASPEEHRVFARLIRANVSPGHRLLRDLLGMSGHRRRMQFLWSKLFPSPTYMQQRYDISHSVLTFLYYPYRWLLGFTNLSRK